MKKVAMAFVAASIMQVAPALAEDQAGQDSSWSGAVVDWVVNTISGSQSADQTLDAKKKPAQSNEEKASGEPTPMEIPDDGTSDHEAYKPDAGEAPQ